MKVLTIPIYDVDIKVFTDRAEAKEFHSAHSANGKPDSSIDTVRGICFNLEYHRMLCVFDNRLSIIVHESVHMAWIVLQELGVKVTQVQDEPLAYLVSWLVEAMVGLLGGTEPLNGSELPVKPL